MKRTGTLVLSEGVSNSTSFENLNLKSVSKRTFECGDGNRNRFQDKSFTTFFSRTYYISIFSRNPLRSPSSGKIYACLLTLTDTAVNVKRKQATNSSIFLTSAGSCSSQVRSFQQTEMLVRRFMLKDCYCLSQFSHVTPAEFPFKNMEVISLNLSDSTIHLSYQRARRTAWKLTSVS